MTAPKDPYTRRLPGGELLHTFRLGHRVQLAKPYFVSLCGNALAFGGPKKLYQMPTYGYRCPQCQHAQQQPFQP